MHVHTRLLVCILEISKRLFCNLVSIFSRGAISDYTHIAKMSPSDKILKMIVQESPFFVIIIIIIIFFVSVSEDR